MEEMERERGLYSKSNRGKRFTRHKTTGKKSSTKRRKEKIEGGRVTAKPV